MVQDKLSQDWVAGREEWIYHWPASLSGVLVLKANWFKEEKKEKGMQVRKQNTANSAYVSKCWQDKIRLTGIPQELGNVMIFRSIVWSTSTTTYILLESSSRLFSEHGARFRRRRESYHTSSFFENIPILPGSSRPQLRPTVPELDRPQHAASKKRKRPNLQGTRNAEEGT